MKRLLLIFFVFFFGLINLGIAQDDIYLTPSERDKLEAQQQTASPQNETASQDEQYSDNYYRNKELKEDNSQTPYYREDPYRYTRIIRRFYTPGGVVEERIYTDGYSNTYSSWNSWDTWNSWGTWNTWNSWNTWGAWDPWYSPYYYGGSGVNIYIGYNSGWWGRPYWARPWWRRNWGWNYYNPWCPPSYYYSYWGPNSYYYYNPYWGGYYSSGHYGNFYRRNNSYGRRPTTSTGNTWQGRPSRTNTNPVGRTTNTSPRPSRNNPSEIQGRNTGTGRAIRTNTGRTHQAPRPTRQTTPTRTYQKNSRNQHYTKPQNNNARPSYRKTPTRTRSSSHTSPSNRTYSRPSNSRSTRSHYQSPSRTTRSSSGHYRSGSSGRNSSGRTYRRGR